MDEINFSDEVLKKLEDPNFLKNELAEGKSFQEIFNYTDETMQAFYKAAYDLFNKQAYEEAADAFFFLTNLNPYIHSYWLGLGMSEHLNDNHHSALIAYSMATLTNPDNPLPHYHAGSCYKALNDLDNAAACYDLAIATAHDFPHHADLKMSAQVAKESIYKN